MPGSFLLGIIFIAFFQPVLAQRVGHIRVTAANASSYRDSLKNMIFGSINFPYDILPDTITTNVSTLDYYAGFPYSPLLYPAGNLDSIDRFAINPSNNATDFPEPVPVYLFHPHNNNGKLFIYQSGHCAAISTIEDVVANGFGTEPGIIIPAMLADGYTVLAVPMINYQIPAHLGYTCGYNNHDALILDGHYQNPLSFFFTALIASLNHLGRSNYSSIYMAGLSGGGWTTSIYPALDSSISCSFPVAGSWPMPVRLKYYAEGDYEQFYPPLYSTLDLHEMYTLACLAPARKMLQINNRYDNCCFSGSFQHIYYIDSVAKALEGTGGTYKFYLDETGNTHAIAKRSWEVIQAFIRNEQASLQTLPADSIVNGENYSYNIKNNFTLNTTPDDAALKYSLLRAPDWLTIDTNTGILNGVVPVGNIIARLDTISFKVEDSTGRFVIYDYTITREREAPYFFTSYHNDSTLYFLPPFSNSIETINPLIAGSLYFNNPLLEIHDIKLDNNSLIKLTMNMPISATDSVGYNGFSSPYALTYRNGLKVHDFALSPINLDAVTKMPAVIGMIRFNKETNKFEYFNGTTWINMN